jgi:hypothetical protein
MNKILFKIYYVFSKMEMTFFPYGKKGGYSSGLMVEMLSSYLLGTASAFSGLFCLIFIRKPFDYFFIIPLVMTILVYCILNHFVDKKNWKEPNEEVLATFEERGIDVINWFIVGLIVWTLSALCAFGGLFLLFWSIGRLPS